MSKLTPQPNSQKQQVTAADDIERQLVQKTRALEAWYSTELDRRLKDLGEMLEGELQAQVADVRAQYEQRQTKGPQISPSEAVTLEITRSEATAAERAEELERLVGDDSVALGRLLQIRSQELELKAYIRGLRFFSTNI